MVKYDFRKQRHIKQTNSYTIYNTDKKQILFPHNAHSCVWATKSSAKRHLEQELNFAENWDDKNDGKHNEFIAFLKGCKVIRLDEAKIYGKEIK